MKKATLLGVLVGATMVASIIGCGPSGGDKVTVDNPDAGAGNAALTGSIAIDGSTTVYPIVQFLAEDFGHKHDGVKLSVNKSGTGSGFTKFLAGETDIVTASRPIKESEDKDAQAKKIEYIEIPIAYDGVSIIVNPANEFLKDVTPEGLKEMWKEGSTIKTWADINPEWPKNTINFYGPSDNHGTFEYFQEAILGKGGSFRKDYQPNQEYNAIIQAIGQDKDGIGYVGFNYFAENTGKVRAVTVNGIAPSEETIKNGTYVPLSRPLFIYVKKSAMDRPEVKAFVDFALNDGISAVSDAKYVQLPDDAMEKVRARVAAGTTGSVFMNAEPGMGIAEVLAKETATP